MSIRLFLELSPEFDTISKKAKRTRLNQDMIIYLGQPLITEGLVSPSDMVPVIAPDKDGKPKVYPMRWGFRIDGIEQPIAEVSIEAARKKDIYNDCWMRHHCVIPAAYYIDRSRIQSGGRIIPGDRYAIQPSGAINTWFAGLHRIEEGYRGFRHPIFTILTQRAVPELKKIHDRMPVMISETDIEAWIRMGSSIKDVILITDLVIEKMD